MTGQKTTFEQKRCPMFLHSPHKTSFGDFCVTRSRAGRENGAYDRSHHTMKTWHRTWSNAGIRSPPVSGKRGARPFLYQTCRGRQILQDAIDDQASSENDKNPIMSTTIMVRAHKKIEEDEDSTPLITLLRMERLLNQMQTIG